MSSKNLKPHIVHIRDSSGIFGAERVILTLAKNIDRTKFNLTILCLKRGDGGSDRLITEAHRHGIGVWNINVRGRLDMGAINRIRALFTREGVSLFHSHDFKSDFYGLLASLGTGIKRVATAHGSTRDSFLKRCYLFFNEMLIYPHFDRIIAVSQDLRDYLTHKRLSREKVVVIQNGLDISLLQLDEISDNSSQGPLRIPSGHVVFSVIGRLFPDKGHRFFLEAFASLRKKTPHIYGLIVGDGPARQDIAELIEKLKLADAVKLCGVRSDMKSIYALTDFLIIPSLREGLPYVLLEAMASKVLVVATSVGDIPFLIKDGKTGFLVPAGDVQSLKKRMEDLLADPRRSAEMAEVAFTHVTKKFSAEIMVSETEKLYNKLLRGNSL